MNLDLRGANLTGGDTFYEQWPLSTGPASGTHYLFIDKGDVDKLIAKGANFFRLVFGWEALQPKPLGAIPGPGRFGVYFQKFKALVDHITLVRKCRVMIDVHGGDDKTFARYFGNLIGSTAAPTAVFTNLWSQLAAIFKGNPLVLFGITNEPTRMPTMAWFGIAQATIDAIRATGAQNAILMPGNYFSGAGSWTSTSLYDTGTPKRSNAYGWDNARGKGLPLRDPLKHLGVQVHLYLDQDAGGSTEMPIVSANVGVERLRVVVNWARPRKLTVLIGEVGLSASDPLAAAAWRNLMTYAAANRDVVLGFAWWAVGPPAWWGEYDFTLLDKQGKGTGQLNLIAGDLLP